MEKNDIEYYMKNRFIMKENICKYLLDNLQYKVEPQNISLVLETDDSQVRNKITVFSIMLAVICWILVITGVVIFVWCFGTTSRINAALLIVTLYIISGIIYLIFNQKYRLNQYRKIYNNNLRYLVLTEEFSIVVLNVEGVNSFTFNKTYMHFRDVFLTNIGWSTSFALYNGDKMKIKTYEILSNKLNNFSPLSVSYKRRGSGYYYWDTEIQLEYFRKFGSQLSYVDEEYIFTNTLPHR